MRPKEKAMETLERLIEVKAMFTNKTNITRDMVRKVIDIALQEQKEQNTKGER